MCHGTGSQCSAINTGVMWRWSHVKYLYFLVFLHIFYATGKMSSVTYKLVNIIIMNRCSPNLLKWDYESEIIKNTYKEQYLLKIESRLASDQYDNWLQSEAVAVPECFTVDSDSHTHSDVRGPVPAHSWNEGLHILWLPCYISRCDITLRTLAIYLILNFF